MPPKQANPAEHVSYYADKDLFKLPSIVKYKKENEIDTHIHEYVLDPHDRLGDGTVKANDDIGLRNYQILWTDVRAKKTLPKETPNYLVVLSDSVIEEIRQSMIRTSGPFSILIHGEPYNIIIPNEKYLGNIAQYQRRKGTPPLILAIDGSINSARTLSLEAHNKNSDVMPENKKAPYLTILDKLGYFDDKHKWHAKVPYEVMALNSLNSVSRTSPSRGGRTRRKRRRA